jgi:hypothetical protein
MIEPKWLLSHKTEGRSLPAHQLRQLDQTTELLSGVLESKRKRKAAEKLRSGVENAMKHAAHADAIQWCLV